MNRASILPVIMSGGAGTRLWPASTEHKPKQFHALAGAASLLQDTALRVRGPGCLSPLIVCGAGHCDLVTEHLRAAGVEPSAVLAEPMPRNTAPVAVAAALWAKAHVPGALVLLMPADHVIGDAAAFNQAVERAASRAREDIVTFGIPPAAPETGYGYIKAGAELAPGVRRVERFVEKPSAEVAARYLAEGRYSWNAGIFLYDSDLMLAEARRLAPEVVAAVSEALASATNEGGAITLDAAAFARAPAVSVDVAIMERTDRAAVAPCDIGWTDIGSWSELWSRGDKDASANHSRGDVEALDAEGCLLWSSGPSISVIGVSGLIVVATPEAVLVLPKSRAQDVKQIVERRRGRS